MIGIYILLIKISKPTNAKIGALGDINFGKGIYAYVGSAQNNLEKRVARHMSKHKKMRWHIDYLLSSRNATAVKALFKEVGKEEECRIANRLDRTEEPVKGFGCSDCKCTSHLFKIINMKNILALKMATLKLKQTLKQ